MDFNTFIAQLTQHTADNEHNEALILITDFFSFRKYGKILRGIKEICDAEGFLPYHIAEYRHQIYGKILEFIKDHSSYEQYKAVYNSL